MYKCNILKIVNDDVNKKSQLIKNIVEIDRKFCNKKYRRKSGNVIAKWKI